MGRLSLRQMACGAQAREIEESTITFMFSERIYEINAHWSGEEGTEDLPCEIGAGKRRFCNPADWLGLKA